MSELLFEGFVCISWACIGNLADVSKEEVKVRLESYYKYEAQQFGNRLGSVSAFVHTKQARRLYRDR
ncbi:hypothetical protein ACFQI7_26315 [Paenibacillus allorhizosphaerae]|nr:hypothetical protein [Paenibacillus allorhizosphaerae]